MPLGAGGGPNIKLTPAAIVCAVAVAALFAARQAQAAAACAIHSLPSFVQQGQGTGSSENVADIVEVQCESTYAGDTVTISSAPLDSACGGSLSWSSPYPFAPKTASSITVKLAGAAAATVALWGTACADGSYLITVHMEQAPFETFTTSLKFCQRKKRLRAW